MHFLLRGGRILNPKTNTDKIADIRIMDGIIAEIGDNLPANDADVLDITGKIAAPGLVDLHVHFRDPGQTHKEEIATGSKAAAHGGVTTVVSMPNTLPTTDTPELVHYQITRGEEEGMVHLLPAACITVGQKSEELTDFEALCKAGACGFSDDGRPVTSDELLRKAFLAAKKVNRPILAHSEILELAKGGAMNEGETSRRLGLKGIPTEAESDAVKRDIALATETGGRLHLCHISTKESIEAIREAKAKGAAITAETAPHYFSLTDESAGVNPNFKMNPPLRSREDVDAVIAALQDGTIDAIATDHAPHSIAEKAQEFQKAPNGIIGLETSLSVGITCLVKPGKLSLMELIAKMSLNPAKILGIHAGNLLEGEPADLVVFDPDATYTVRKEDFLSKAENSPYIGEELYGVTEITICGGKIAYQRK